MSTKRAANELELMLKKAAKRKENMQAAEAAIEKEQVRNEEAAAPAAPEPEPEPAPAPAALDAEPTVLAAVFTDPPQQGVRIIPLAADDTE